VPGTGDHAIFNATAGWATDLTTISLNVNTTKTNYGLTSIIRTTRRFTTSTSGWCEPAGNEYDDRTSDILPNGSAADTGHRGDQHNLGRWQLVDQFLVPASGFTAYGYIYCTAGGAVGNREILDSLPGEFQRHGQPSANGHQHGNRYLDLQSGTIKLAKTNLFVGMYGVLNPNASPGPSAELQIGYDGNHSAPGGTLELGQTNAFFCKFGMTVGSKRANDSRVYFGPSFAGNNPAAYFRNVDGTGRQAVWWIGNASEIAVLTGGSSAYAKGTVDFSGGTVDALVDSLVIGKGNISAAYMNFVGGMVLVRSPSPQAQLT